MTDGGREGHGTLARICEALLALAHHEDRLGMWQAEAVECSRTSALILRNHRTAAAGLRWEAARTCSAT
jgi:hypothetical protein